MIDKKLVQKAFDDLEPGNVYFIDRKTKKVSMYTLKDLAGLETLKKEMKADPQRFAQIPKPQPAENMAEMEAFIAQVHDPKLKEAMKRAMTSHRPFREFRDLLDTKIKEKREWDAFHKKNLEARTERFLKSASLV
jgi:hypothetical protein